MQTELPQKIRAFVGLFAPLPLIEALTGVQDYGREQLPGNSMNWTRPEQIHLTLNFLGNIPSSRLQEFEDVLSRIAAGEHPFALQCQGLGCFPNTRNPKVLWAGLTGEITLLLRLKSLLDDGLEKLGIAREERAFHPHLTIGRVKHLVPKERRKFEQMLEGSGPFFGEWPVERMDFVRSNLTPEGSQYSILKSFPLGAAK